MKLMALPTDKDGRLIDPPARPGPDPHAGDLVERLLGALPAHYRAVVVHYFALGGADQKNTEELALELGVTRSRVQQVLARGLEPMREGARTLGFDDHDFSPACTPCGCRSRRGP